MTEERLKEIEGLLDYGVGGRGDYFVACEELIAEVRASKKREDWLIENMPYGEIDSHSELWYIGPKGDRYRSKKCCIAAWNLAAREATEGSNATNRTCN